MAVQALYFSERDGQDMALKNPGKMLFANKADADARDKMLELSEEILVFLKGRVKDLSDEQAEQCALAIAEERDLFLRALKKPSLLNEAVATSQSE
jgi:dsDNA-binding SOS-regulon protein